MGRGHHFRDRQEVPFERFVGVTILEVEWGYHLRDGQGLSFERWTGSAV